MDLWKEWGFWLAIAFATAVKWRVSPAVSLAAAAVSTVAAITGALLFTDPVVDFLALGHGRWNFAVAALVALTCEHIGRLLLGLSLDDLVKLIRGQK